MEQGASAREACDFRAATILVRDSAFASAPQKGFCRNTIRRIEPVKWMPPQLKEAVVGEEHQSALGTPELGSCLLHNHSLLLVDPCSLVSRPSVQNLNCVKSVHILTVTKTAVILLLFI